MIWCSQYFDFRAVNFFFFFLENKDVCVKSVVIKTANCRQSWCYNAVINMVRKMYNYKNWIKLFWSPHSCIENFKSMNWLQKKCRICRVYCNFYPCCRYQTKTIFCNMTVEGLLIHTLASFKGLLWWNFWLLQSEKDLVCRLIKP